ncbi:hypothetical protein KAR91_51055 [Candidatus Pacearchaeota archaeon]|nr:hypothetical protein [Candidatus Pacearchaeota archaeon]
MGNLYERFKQKYVEIHDEENKKVIIIDATISENHSLSAKATNHEIEDGSNISDHIINKGRKLVIEGIKSDDPFTLASIGLTTSAGLVSNMFEGLRSAAVVGAVGAGFLIADELFPSDKPSKTAMDVFDELYEEKHTIKIITGLKQYTNMVLESLSIPRTAKNSQSLTFKATFRNIILAQFSEPIAIGPEDVLLGNAVPKTSEGTKLAEEVSEDIDTKGKTLLRSAFDFITN